MYAWTVSRTSWERFPWDVFSFKNASISSRFSFSSRSVIRSFSSIPDSSPQTREGYDRVIHHSGISWRVSRCIQDDPTYTFCQLSYDVGQDPSIVVGAHAQAKVLNFISYAR